MSRNARIWTGITLLVVLLFNYGLIGMPLYRKSANLHDKATTMLMARVKSGNVLRTTAEEEYILEIFRREKSSIDNRLLILNSVAVTIAVLIISWSAFGLIMPKKRQVK